MRSLYLVASLSALSLGGYWTLTSGPLAPAPGASAVVEEVSSDVVMVSGLTPEAAPTDATQVGGGGLPPVRVDLSARSYSVEGDSPDALLQSLLSKGPEAEGSRFFGLTEAAIDLHYDQTPVEGACVIENAQVLLALTITLPEWQIPAGADPALSRSWHRFRRALAGHEGRHQDIAEEGAEALHRAVDGLRRESCDAVAEEARRRLERLEIEIAAAHQRYDAETGHGRTEGAVWPSR